MKYCSLCFCEIVQEHKTTNDCLVALEYKQKDLDYRFVRVHTQLAAEQSVQPTVATAAAQEVNLDARNSG